MIRYTDRVRTTEQEVLALDSIYRFLTLHERILLHYMAGHLEAETTERIEKFIRWVEDTRWETPYMKYPEFHKDVLHYEDERGQLRPVEEYPNAHKEITEQILKLKI